MAQGYIMWLIKGTLSKWYNFWPVVAYNLLVDLVKKYDKIFFIILLSEYRIVNRPWRKMFGGLPHFFKFLRIFFCKKKNKKL